MALLQISVSTNIWKYNTPLTTTIQAKKSIEESKLRGDEESTGYLVSEPSEHLHRQLHKPHRQIRKPRTAHATRAQATQHRSAIKTAPHFNTPSILITYHFKF